MAKLSPSKRGIAYEKRQATKTKSKHVGGPGNPDLIKDGKKKEVKNLKKPVHSGIVRKAKQKGMNEIISSSGFTEPAKKLAKKKGIKLKKGK